MSKRLAAVLLVLLTPLAALAQEAPPLAAPAQPPHRHLGFFIRPELGFGSLSSSASSGGLEAKVSGGGGVLALAIGGAVSENFIVAGQFWDYTADKPKVSLTGFPSATADGTASLVGWGVLLNWYFMPSNLYLAVTPSLTKITTESGTSSGSSEWGLGLRAALGWEWWVSDHWGLGLAASLGLSSNKDQGSGAPTWGTGCFGLTFSATYN